MTLFCIKINSIVKHLSPGVKYSLDIDNCLIIYGFWHRNTIERQHQKCLSKIHKFDTCFTFFKMKTNYLNYWKLSRVGKTHVVMSSDFSVFHTECWTARQTLIRLSWSLIHLQLNYGRFIYGAGRKSYIKIQSIINTSDKYLGLL